MVNPVGFKEAYDSRTQQPGVSPIFDASLQPPLPYLAQPDTSIIKAISLDPGRPTCRPCLRTAAVLTVLRSVPPDGGRTVFRPPYFGSSKPLISTRALRMDVLPSLARPSPPAALPTLAQIQERFQRPQLDHVLPTWLGDNMHPSENMPNYGALIARDTGDAVLRLLLDDPPAEKLPALIVYVQYGIDAYYTQLGGMRWEGAGGLDSGRKLPIAFAALLLDDPTMMHTVSLAAHRDTYGEDTQVYFSSAADGGKGKVLWGAPCTEAQYWERIDTHQGRRDCRDPYGQIDGGGDEIGMGYQACCTSEAWKGAALALYLMPRLAAVWANPLFFSYVDRWVKVGVWALPDPCAPIRPNPFVGRCVPGSGRFPLKQGINRDGGDYRSTFADAMWRSYR
jgi:hypothetical protein